MSGFPLPDAKKNFVKGSGGDMKLEQYNIEFNPNAVFIYAELAGFRA